MRTTKSIWVVSQFLNLLLNNNKELNDLSFSTLPITWTWAILVSLMNSESFTEMKVLLESFHQETGHWILGHVQGHGSLCIGYHSDFEKGVFKLKVVGIKGWKHPLLNMLGLSIHMYPQLLCYPIGCFQCCNIRYVASNLSVSQYQG